MLVLAELTPLNKSTGLRPTVRVASSHDRNITGLNSQKWWPALHQPPALGIRLFDGDFSSDITPGEASFTLLFDGMEKADPNVRGYAWAGAGVTFYGGSSGTAWPWTILFVGKVDRFQAEGNRLTLTAKVNTEPFEADVLTARYAGTGGAEGGADIKNQPKPWVFGRAANVEPILIDATNNVYQFSGYGPIEAVTTLYERGSDFGAKVADHASYAALIAATIPNGRWATCLAQGLVRLGAPAFGVITGDVDGDKPGGVWIRKTGAIISRIATNAGIASGSIDSASLTALDAAVPYNINLVLKEQTTVLELAQRLARPCNAQAGISLLGKLFVTRPVIGATAMTLDAQGRRLPAVISSVEMEVRPPYWRVEMGAQRSWRVHSFDEIATFAPYVERGVYSASDWYRENNIVENQSVRWVYINTTPGSGTAPPTLPTTSNSHWKIWDAKLGGVEDNADVTRNIGFGPAEATVRYDYLGAAESGELPRTLVYKLFKNGVAQTSGIVWSYTVLTGTVNGFTSASGVQSISGAGSCNFTLSSLGSNEATIELKAVQGTLTTRHPVKLTKSIAPAPAAGGDGGGGGTSTIAQKTSGFTGFSTTTFTDITGSLAGTMPTGKTTANVVATLTVNPQVASPNGSWNVEVKVQRDVAGVWTDVGSLVNSDPDPAIDVESGIYSLNNTGQISLNVADTGRTAGTAYSWRLVARLTSGPKTMSVTGTVSITA